MSPVPASLLRFAPVPLAAVVLAGVLSARAPTSRTLYISAVDSKDAPVTDLTAADLTLKEGGKDREIGSVQAATAPIDVSMVIDDGGSGVCEGVAVELINRLAGHAQYAIRLINLQSMLIQSYTSDADKLKTALTKLRQRARVTPDPDQILETVGEAARELQKKKSPRSAIVACTVYGENHKAVDPEEILSALKASGASLNVIYAHNSMSGQLLGDGPRQSGGRSEEANSGDTFQTAGGRIADILAHQYQVSYMLPDGVKPSDRLEVKTSRKGITLLAPTRIPDRIQ
jgi:hypothetical protein